MSREELTAFRMRRLKAIYARYTRDYRVASLRAHGGPKLLCPGRGSMTPVAILVGEAPGDHENRKRKPFAGPAGDVLTGVLTSIGLTRSDVFVTNVVKYRPTVGQISIRNRTPSTAEQVASWPYLMEELDVFPRETPVVAMGNVALYALHWHATWRISDAHGTSWERQDGRPAYAWYHPAVAVYDPDMMPTLVDDARTTLLTDVLRGRQRR